MATQVQFRRGTTAQNSTFTGAVGEITVDTDKDTLLLHDGGTAGGFEIVNVSTAQTLSNKTLSNPVVTGNLTVDTNTLYVDAANNRVGIGTSSPSVKLHIEDTSTNTYFRIISNSSNTAGILFGDQDATSQGKLYYLNGSDAMRFDTAGTERMRIDSSGNVGIGTTSPATKLSLPNDAQLSFQNASGSMTGGSAGAWIVKGSDNNLKIDNFEGSTIFRGSGYAERMRIDSSGNVGIGASSPGGKLDIRGASVSYTTVASPSSSIWTGKNFAFRDEASYGTGVGGAIVFEGKYNAAGDLSTYGWIRGSKKNATDGDPYGNIYYGTRYGHHIFVTDANGYTNGTGEKMRITDVGNVGIGTSVGTTTVSSGLAINNATATNYPGLEIQTAGTTRFYLNTNNTSSFITTVGSIPMVFSTNTTERMRIEESQGAVLIGGASLNPAANIVYANPEVAGQGMHLVVSKTVAAAGSCLYLNRQGNDGDLIEFRQANTTEGKITVSGTTVSYNGGHLSRFAQLPNSTKDETILKGTVLSNLDDMCVYVNAETGESVDNEQLNKVKVSDVEGDPNVAGVHVSWIYDEQHDVEEINMAMTGDMIIRIAQGVTVNRGDLLMSAGDGTAKPQGDDIVRSKTIAKVTSTSVTCTYEDGSYCVPCVLMAC